MPETIFISPHLDDAALSCGAAIARLVSASRPVTVVTVCTSDPPPDCRLSSAARRFHASWALGDAPFEVRCGEDHAALDRLGARAVHLGLPDAVYRTGPDGEPWYPRRVSVPACDGDAEAVLPLLTKMLGDTLGARGAERVFCPFGVGSHVDHLLVRAAVESLADPRLIVYYEEYPYLSRRAVRRPASADRPLNLTVLSPTLAEIESRIDAIACYRSQLRGLFPSAVERASEVLSARVPVVGRHLRPPDSVPPLERVRQHVWRDLAEQGGERYFSDPAAGMLFPAVDQSRL